MYTIGDFARINASRLPAKPAIILNHRILRYCELDALADQLAACLLRRGIKTGDRIGILAFNSPEFVIILQAVARIGAILVPYNVRHSCAELAWQTTHARPALVFIERDLIPQFGAALDQAGISLQLLIIEDCLSADPVWTLTLPDARPARDLRIAIDAQSPATIMYTSGSSGRPKGVVTSHDHYIRIFTGVAVDFDLVEEDIVHAAMPFFHNGGFASVLCPALMVGATVVCAHGAFDAAAIFADIERHGVTLAHFIPTMLERLVGYAETAPVNTSALAKIHYGAMPMPNGLLARAARVFVNARFYQFFASTDAGLIGCLRPEDHRREPPATARALFSTLVRIVDDAGADVAEGDVGEIVIDARSSGMSEYWHDPVATALVKRDGWIATGDIARKLADGFFAVIERKNFMIISGGENIYPAEVERVIEDHPDVAEVAVVGAPDAVFGQQVCAFVVLRPGAAMDLGTIREYCAIRLARYKLPRQLRVIAQLPRSGPGKVAKGELAALARTPLK